MDNILIIDDDKEILETFSKLLESSRYKVSICDNAKDGVDMINSNVYNIVISDIQMPVHDGIWLVNQIDLNRTPIILMTAFGTIEKAVGAMKMGVSDFITKPFRKKEIVALIEEHKKITYDDFVTLDEQMMLIRGEITNIGDKKVPILLTGESGVGKDVIANYIHRVSGRKGNFVAINCAAIPDGMLESILFGYEKGSFTGAYKKHDGKFIMADGGTLFLDEIGEMDLDLQSKILRVIETGDVDTIGGKISKKIDLNIITATNINLPLAIEQKKFRLDLYYRINVIELCIPGLRKRPKDLNYLIDKFISLYSKEYGKKLTLNKEDRVKLAQYEWPGNIRELKNVIQRACIVSNSVIKLTNFLETKTVGADITKLEETLYLHDGNRKKIAEDLGISVRTLQYKIKKAGLNKK